MEDDHSKRKGRNHLLLLDDQSKPPSGRIAGTLPIAATYVADRFVEIGFDHCSSFLLSQRCPFGLRIARWYASSIQRMTAAISPSNTPCFPGYGLVRQVPFEMFEPMPSSLRDHKSSLLATDISFDQDRSGAHTFLNWSPPWGRKERIRWPRCPSFAFRGFACLLTLDPSLGGGRDLFFFGRVGSTVAYSNPCLWHHEPKQSSALDHQPKHDLPEHARQLD